MAFETRGFSPNTVKLTRSLFFLLCSLFMLPQESLSEFYKYVDKNGTVHYVDSKVKIPKEYREGLIVYEEKYDHFSEEEREKKIEEEHRQAEALRIKREAHLGELRRQAKIAEERILEQQKKEELEEKKQKEWASREEYLKRLQTKIIIEGNHVLVPCTLGYDKYEVEVMLVLDTGCDITTVYEDTAKKLNIKEVTSSRAQVAGGGILRVKVAKLKYIKVGPYKKEDMLMGIIKHKGPAVKQSGLLGMNFLRGLDYNIDYFNELIRWTSPEFNEKTVFGAE